MPIILQGLPANDPKSRIARQFLFAQGGTEGFVGGRDIVLVGNALGGTEPVEATPATPFQNAADVYARVGRKGEIACGWRVLNQVAPNATVWPCVVAQNGGATASTTTFTIATTADAASTIAVSWGGRTLQVGVQTGDIIGTQATNVANAINGDPDLPFTAATGGGGGAVITLTTSNAGPRYTSIMNAVRMAYLTPIASSVTKGAVVAGTTADSFTNALAALAAKEIYYHVPSATMPIGGGAPTAADHQIGEYIANINAWALPSVGYSEQVIFGLDATQAQAATVATASAANAVLAKFIRVNANDWTSFMVACHAAGALWLKENSYAGASMTNYTTNSAIGTVFNVPDPFLKTNRPTPTEISADLNNGVTPVCFTSQGGAFFNRMITSYNVLPGTSNKDYDAREGHIPSVIHYAWAYCYSRWLKQRQQNVAADLPKGRRPIPGFNTPGGLLALLNNVVDVLSSTAAPQGIPILDPSPDAVARMKASIFVQQTNNGLAASVDWEPARHDNQDDFLVLQGGANT